MSASRAKGTKGENWFLPGLRWLWGDSVERAPLKGVQDNGDYVGVPYQIEAKSTKKPLFLEWARKATSKSWPWVILWKGDLRKSEGPYVLMPYEFYLALQDVANMTVDDPVKIARKIRDNPYILEDPF